MTLVDRIKNIFRKRKRRSFYAGASQNRLLNNFTLTSKSADSEIKQSLRILRSRSRDLSRNNAYDRRYVNVYVDNIVGAKGVHLTPHSLNLFSIVLLAKLSNAPFGSRLLTCK